MSAPIPVAAMKWQSFAISAYYRARGASIAHRTRKSWADREAALLREGMALLSQRDGARAASALLLGYAEVAA